MFSLVTEISPWLFLACIALGVGYAFLLYYKNRNIEFPKKTSILLYTLRGLAITLIAFLLLSPMVKRMVKTKEKPIVFLALDQSESITAYDDSAWYCTEFIDQVNHLQKTLGDENIIEKYTLGEKPQFLGPDEEFAHNFSKKSTDLSSFFDHLNTHYSQRNIGAVVFLSDGIYNVGGNPYYKVKDAKYPVYSIGMGRADLQTDLAITHISHNKQTFKGNFFPVEIKIAATKLTGKKSLLTVKEKDSVIYSKEIAINNQQYYETIKFSLEANSMGIKHYNVELEALEEENTTKNNVQSFFIEVMDQREKIAIIYHAPHPDLGAIKSALDLSNKFQTETFAVEEAPKSLEEYSLAILHQLPSSKKESTALLNALQRDRVPSLYIIGNQTEMATFNTLSAGVNIQRNNNLFNASFPAFNNNFVSFSFDETSKKMLENYPPLETFFGNYKTAISADIFMYQNISNVTTSYPLILFNDNNGQKTGVIAGTGIWQWKIHNYLHANNHNAFNDIINKMALYLSVKADNSFFRVFAKNVYDENQSITFSAELFDETYQLNNQPDVALTVTAEDGTEYQATFSKQNNAYSCSLGNLPVGNYQYDANVQFGNKTYNKSGIFTVRAVMLEQINLVARHDILQKMAENTHGKFYLANNFSNIVNDIQTNENIKSIVNYEHKYSLLLNSWLYFIIIILLMGVEWFLRKWHGGY